MRVFRTKPYRLRRVGDRGVICGIPQAYAAEYGLEVGSLCVPVEDDEGNLVLVFPHSKLWKKVTKKLEVEK